MILATSLVVWRTRVLPSWVAIAGVLGVLPLLHLWLPIVAALSSLLWFVVLGAALLVARTVPAEDRDAAPATV